MMTVCQVARLAGVSERTLRYYDRMGLLPPTDESAAGYRLYDEEALKRLQRILFLRELDVPLKQIAPMLEAEARDQHAAIEQHRELLRLKQKRLQGLIDLCDRLLKGEKEMSLNEFDQQEIQDARERYAQEVQQRWGQTDAYRESERRHSSYKEKDYQTMKQESDEILREIAALVGSDPRDAAARSAIRKFQAHISQWHYPCTDEILAGLGEMYDADERFVAYLNRFGQGTAHFMTEVIRHLHD